MNNVETEKKTRVVRETIDFPASRFIDETSYCEALVLCCPVCEYDYSHCAGAFSLLGNDPLEGGGSGYPGTETDGSTPYRRNALAVRFKGECGHLWDVVFQQHKGNTFIRVDVLDRRREDQ